jgi:seryl-tRNA synthetase
MIDISKLNKDQQLQEWYVNTRLGGDPEMLQTAIAQYQKLKELKLLTEALRKERKRHNPLIQPAQQGQLIKNTLQALLPQQRELEASLHAALLRLPNIIDDSVSSGEDVIVTHWGETLRLTGATHHELLDMSMATKLAKAKFPMLQGDLALLHRALGSYMLEVNIKAGYQECYLPYLCNAEALTATGQLPGFADDLFRADELYLIPTGEVPLTNLYRNMSLAAETMPIKLTALTPCFRKEAGSYGKAVHGLKRQHQFDKVEIVDLVEPGQGLAALENMVTHVASILTALKLPHRVVMLGHKELGFASSKTYDLEVWLPRSQEYMEISSCSFCGDFQARRMKCKVSTYSKKVYVHTLNGSSLAVGRCLIAMIENHLEAGRLKVPSVLVPYCLGKEWLTIS